MKKLFLSFAFTILFSSAAGAAPVRLTQSAGFDTFPAWEPGGDRIVYMRSLTGTGVPFDLYYCLASGGACEQPFLTGLNTEFGVGNSPSWVGSFGVLLTEERISGHEYLAFDTTQFPFARTAANGDDGATALALGVRGGGAGGYIRVSRNGLKAVVRMSQSFAAGLTTVSVGDLSTATGQLASDFGTKIINENTGSEAKYLNGAGISPDGTTVAIPVPIGVADSGHDIIQYLSDGSGLPTNLTNNAAQGVRNIYPDYSPDGTKIVFTRWSGVVGEAYDLYVMDVNGANLKQITNTPFFSETIPNWSPNGKKIVFAGVHLAGMESQEPALPAGESANFNIYTMDFEEEQRTVTPAIIPDAPEVTVAADDATVTAEEFDGASFKKAKAAARALSEEARAKAPKVSFKYEFTIKRSADQNGAPVKKNQKQKLTKKNEYTFKNLPPGSYTASYRVEITQKSGQNVKVKRTKPSPSTGFSIVSAP